MTTTNHTSPSGEDAANGATWVPELLDGPRQTACWTQDEIPRNERIEVVVISHADYQRVCAALTAEKVAAEPYKKPDQSNS